MNRLSPLCGTGSAPKAGTSSGTADLSLVSSMICGGGLKLKIFAPLHYEKNYPYPLLVWLHGPGSDDSQLVRIMPWVSMRNYVATAPRAPTEGSCAVGADWSAVAGGTERVGSLVRESIRQVAERYHVDGRRIFLAGYQSGGETALRVALNEPDRFAGVISINGSFPRDGAPLTHLAAARSLPILIAHGQTAESYPLHQLCDDLRLFHAAGMTVTVRQYPCGDEIHAQMLRDMNIWMMEQVTGQSIFEETHYRQGRPDAN